MRPTSSPVLIQLVVTIGLLYVFGQVRPAEPLFSYGLAVALGLGFAVLTRVVDAVFRSKALETRRYLLLGLIWAVLASGILALEAALGGALWGPVRDLLLFVPLAIWLWWQPRDKGEQTGQTEQNS